MALIARLFAVLTAAVLLTAPARAEAPAQAPVPAFEPKVAEASKAMVVAARPEAVEAGYRVLRAGGSAVDAAIAVQAVLALVEPQSSSMAGGAFALVWDPETRRITAYDGRETAPAAAKADRFLSEDGTPMAFPQAVLGGKSVGVPGVPALLEMMHGDHGRAAWAGLFADAIALGEAGFVVTPRLHRLMTLFPLTKQMPDALAYFFDADGEPLPVGALIKNEAYAQTLRAFAEQGAKGFYEGPVAEAIVAAVAGAPNHAGDMTLADLKAYAPVRRAASCVPYRAWSVCSMPPPAGGVTVAQVMGMLARFPASDLAPGTEQAVHLISEASRLAYADRGLYLADPDAVAVPAAGLLAPDYLARRAWLIKRGASLGTATPGEPQRAPARALGAGVPEGGTTHFVVVDEAGLAVTMTSSVEFLFGSHIMAGGMFLNNQLTDFSFLSVRDDKPVANAVAPGKRPRSSMSPTMVLDADGAPHLMIGTAGGSRIPAHVVRIVSAVLDGGQTVGEAIAAPNHINRNGPVELERGSGLEALQAGLEARGAEVTLSGLNTGFHGLERTDAGWRGGADPRREGIVKGY